MSADALCRGLACAVAGLAVIGRERWEPSNGWQDKRRRGAARSVCGYSRAYAAISRGAPVTRSLRKLRTHWRCWTIRDVWARPWRGTMISASVPSASASCGRYVRCASSPRRSLPPRRRAARAAAACAAHASSVGRGPAASVPANRLLTSHSRAVVRARAAQPNRSPMCARYQAAAPVRVATGAAASPAANRRRCLAPGAARDRTEGPWRRAQSAALPQQRPPCTSSKDKITI